MSKLNKEHFYCGLTHSGKVRQHNEDFYIIDKDLGLAVVCDGMGGHAAGEVASKKTVVTVHNFIKEKKSLLAAYEAKATEEGRAQVQMMIDQAVQKACQEVWKEAQTDTSKAGMGTTIALLLFCGNSAFVAHVGDSRVYLFREGVVQQLTEDHTLVNEYIRQGIIKKEQSHRHPQGNVIMRAVGIQEAVQVDIIHMEVMSDDRFVLCSDGLSDYLMQGEMAEFFLNHKVDELANTLVNHANSCGGKDNTTVLVLEYRKSNQIESENSKIVAQKIKTLQGIPMFSKFEYQELNRLLDIIVVRTYLENQTIITEGDKGDEMFVLLKGEATVTLKGNKINHKKSGDFFGEMSLIDNADRMATVKAITHCKFLVFKRDKFFNLLDKNPTMAAKVYWAFLTNLNYLLREKENELLKLKKTA